MGIDIESNNINVLGEFCDKDLEEEFFHDYMDRNIKYIRPIVLAFGILNLLFIIPDFFFIENRQVLPDILVNRIAFLMSIIIFFFFINRLKNYKYLARWVTAFEILGCISFLMVFEQYGSPNFLIQTFGVIVEILVIFIVPNKWLYMLISSTFVSVAFFLFSIYIIADIPIAEYLAGIVYIMIVLVLSAMGSFRSNYYNRKQYIYRKELLKLSSTDWLTGINNRANWNSKLKHCLSYVQRYGVPLSVAFFDIDDFKKINDLLGHLVGDKVIVEIANMVKDAIRESDVFARWGGDEFMLMLPNTDEGQALVLVERLRKTIENHNFKEVGRVTCSFGLTMANESDNVSSLVNRADKLLYISKQRGKNIVSVEGDSDHITK